MQLGDPTVLQTSSGEAVAAEAAPPEGREAIGVDDEEKEIKEDGGGVGGGGEGDKINFGGNRWPRQETLALLKIRSDMDAMFRDSNLKGPLWEEVSRKLAELGYRRSAKKCKEKFENVYKYHKRTKESRSGKPEGKKTYKFFDQLQALENQFTVSYLPKPQPTLATNTVPLLQTRSSDTTTPIPYAITVPSTNPTVISPPPLPLPPTTITSTTVITNPRNPSSQPDNNNNNNNINVAYSLPNMNLFYSTSTSSSTASDEDWKEKYRKKRKRKEYFRRLTRQVLAKQEEMQKRFLEAIDKREREQVAQQDAWRMQEMARINREHEILVQERSTAAAKDAAVIAFLQKLSGLQSPITPAAITVPSGGNFLQQLPTPPPPLQQQQPPPLQSPPQLQPPPPPPPVSQVQPEQQQQQPPLMPTNNLQVQKVNNGHSVAPLMSPSSRWPKAEVHALIRLRTSLEAKYQDNGPKAPLWEDISAGMQRLGYNRSAKRCKEKWENINKYFKKVKESKKQRREDSKTCPYFHELDAIYKEKSESQNPFSFHNMKPNELMEPLMVQPEQQWRPPPQYEHNEQLEEGHVANDNNNNACHQHEAKKREREEEEEEEEDNEEVDDGDDNVDDAEDDDGDSVEEEGASRYEIATNKLSSVDTVE